VNGDYRVCTVHGAGEFAEFTLDGDTVGWVAVADLLP